MNPYKWKWSIYRVKTNQGKNKKIPIQFEIKFFPKDKEKLLVCAIFQTNRMKSDDGEGGGVKLILIILVLDVASIHVSQTWKLRLLQGKVVLTTLLYERKRRRRLWYELVMTIFVYLSSREEDEARMGSNYVWYSLSLTFLSDRRL